jgi:uncharacterized membrane protein
VKAVATFAALALLAAGRIAYATDAAPAKPMKMDEPMPIKMTKEGMKVGDVKKAAEKKDIEMKPMLDKESAEAAKK